MKNDLENEVNDKKKIKRYNTTTGSNSRPIANAGAAYHWAMWPVGESGVKLQYKLAKTRRVNIPRMRDGDDPTSVIGRYDILHFCR